MNLLKRCGAVAVLLAMLAWPARGAEFFVDNVAGSDANDGTKAAAAFSTIARAIQAAQAGDTIRLKPNREPYREAAIFRKGGAPGKPITLDGNGSTISGSNPCPADGWTARPDGVLRRSDIVSRTILVVDGEIVYAKRVYDCLKPGEIGYDPGDRRFFHLRAKPGSGKVEARLVDGSTLALEPGQWRPAGTRNRSVVLAEAGPKAPVSLLLDGVETPLVAVKERLEPGEWCPEAGPDGKPVMYYRPPAGKKIGDLRIECVLRGEGVDMAGKFGHVTVKNLTAVHFWNDGYNIHGAVKDAVFLNCDAHHCGDEGFSAHDDCETVLDGAVYRFCDNGIFNVNRAKGVTRNVILADNRSVGFGCHEDTVQTLENVILVDNPGQLVVGSRDRVTVDNLLMVRTGGSGGAIGAGGTTVLARMTVAGHTQLLRAVVPGSQITFADCLLAAGQGIMHVRVDDPSAILRLRNTVIGAGTRIEWRAAPPWKSLPMEEWIATVEKKELVENTTVSETPWAADLVRGAEMQESVRGGCTRELLKKFAAFMAQRAQAAK